jgi:DNA gyrase subunit A
MPQEEDQGKKEKQEKLVDAEISEEMQKAYIDYAMSVIVSRALPAVEDGLKPVQRRILYSMNLMGLQPNKQTRKCARIVGDTIGKYHPHGDAAVYDALVRMAQDFSSRYPLIHGQGNFGSIDGDPAAAYRYTEAKLSKISLELLQDLEKETVTFMPNFDNSLKEPVTFPAKLPNLLINGATGIAVGMTTNIPPHNLGDVIDAIIEFINKPNIKLERLAAIIKGPDFPTGGYVVGDNLLQFYKTGKASLIVRGKTMLEHGKTERIVITEIPYQLNKSELIKEIARLMENKKLPDVSTLRDESAKGKIRIILGLKKGANPKFTINRLYQYTRLQTRFDSVMIALVSGQPKLLNLQEVIREYVNYRKQEAGCYKKV